MNRWAQSAEPRQKSGFGRTEHRAAASYEGEQIRIQLREAVAREGVLRRRIDELIQQQETLSRLFARLGDAANRVASLTSQERKIMELIVAGYSNKIIAADLAVSRRTVENHRASIMKKTGSKSLPALVRLALAAAWKDATNR
jgi:DNA-binding NarL/FixJ family response regulator